MSTRAKPKLRLKHRAALAIGFAAFVQTTILAAQNVSPDDRQQQARTAYETAERAASELRFVEAVDAYDRAMTLDPSAPFVRIARARVADLRAHAEGNFVPLARLESVRRSLTTTREDIDELARDAAQFPAGRVRSEAQLVVAEAYWHRFGEPDLAAHALEAVLVDSSADRVTRTLALGQFVALERERDRLEAAARIVAMYPDLSPSLRAEMARLVRRVWLGRVAKVVVVAVLLVGVLAVIRAILGQRRDPDLVLREVVRPASMAFALYMAGAASLLVRLHGEGDVRPFLWLGLGVLAIDAAARGWRLGFVDERKVARMVRAITCGVAVVALAFLALQYADAAYLETLGL